MNHHMLLRPVATLVFGALALGTLSACATTEPVSATRVAATSRIPASQAAPTSTPPAEAAQPAPAPAPPRTTTPPAAPSTTTSPTSQPSTSDNEAVRLIVVTDPKLGAIVVDGDGKSLYRLDSDSARPPKSNCAGDCARRFPPVLVPTGATIEIEGLERTLVGTLDRADRTIQLTLAGRPLYRFAGDTDPGDALGHGLAGAFAITPTGAKAAARTAD